MSECNDNAPPSSPTIKWVPTIAGEGEPRPRSLSNVSAGGVGYNAGRRRTSSFGTFTRVVVVAVDSSDNAKNAFDCKIYHSNNIAFLSSILGICA